MRRHGKIFVACLALFIAGTPLDAQEGRGQGKAQAKQAKQAQDRGNAGQRAQPQGRGQDRGSAGEARGNAGERGRSDAARAERGNSGDARSRAGERGRGAARAEARQAIGRLNEPFRSLQRSERASDRFVLGATAFGALRGLDSDRLELRRRDDRVQVWNGDGDLLLDLDERRARDLGSWDMRLIDSERVRDNAPAFCRSGAGHPVWGREWCLEKGFGLGRDDDRRWSRTTDVGDIIWGRSTERDRDGMARERMIDIVGDVIFGRLALHALSLGFAEPLVGRWVAEPAGPRLLLINAGSEPVAEFVDYDRDDEVDVLYVTHHRY